MIVPRDGFSLPSGRECGSVELRIGLGRHADDRNFQQLPAGPFPAAIGQRFPIDSTEADGKGVQHTLLDKRPNLVNAINVFRQLRLNHDLVTANFGLGDSADGVAMGMLEQQWDRQTPGSACGHDHIARTIHRDAAGDAGDSAGTVAVYEFVDVGQPEVRAPGYAGDFRSATNELG